MGPDSPIRERISSSEHRTTILERSNHFITAVQQLEPFMIHDPEIAEPRTIRLFHGVRRRHLEQFQRCGVKPYSRQNEFQSGPAFYCSTVLSQAYKHPFHVHPAWTDSDNVAVFAFDILTAILHADNPPSPYYEPFSMCYYESDGEEWNTFCVENLHDQEKDTHDFDVVIGPACIPAAAEEDRVVLLRTADGHLAFQVAFCSKRSWDWLSSTVSKVYVEKS
ncbi:hypothetical protein BC832DRAFT_531790 [Gaertneriomyces semiglobifer]|nr:hypothetical protein BC832DRAFT_531790 [Gaertneriomyces semiglobifer]